MTRAGGHFFKSGRVVAVVGAHEAVPHVEVEAVVSTHLFMVLNVMGGRVDDLTQP